MLSMTLAGLDRSITFADDAAGVAEAPRAVLASDIRALLAGLERAGFIAKL